MSLITKHAQKSIIRAQLKQNIILQHLTETEMAELEPHLVAVDCQKGECLLHQGDLDMEQYFILDGILKRVVAGPQAKEMILRFTDAGGMETSYAAWRLKTPAPYSILAVTKARVAKLPLPLWVQFMNAHAAVKEAFEYEVMRSMSEIMAHTITLHLLDAPGRVHRFLRKHPDFSDRVPKKELASHLNLCAETLSRLQHQGKIELR
jgi:CRP-like cAMP-binding protein